MHDWENLLPHSFVCSTTARRHSCCTASAVVRMIESTLLAVKFSDHRTNTKRAKFKSWTCNSSLWQRCCERNSEQQAVNHRNRSGQHLYEQKWWVPAISPLPLQGDKQPSSRRLGTNFQRHHFLVGLVNFTAFTLVFVVASVWVAYVSFQSVFSWHQRNLRCLVLVLVFPTTPLRHMSEFCCTNYYSSHRTKI